MKKFREFKCPNGQPPESCLHVPQLVINLLDYLTKKSEMHKELSESHDSVNMKGPRGSSSVTSKNGQKQRRRG